MAALFDGAPVFPTSLGAIPGGPPALGRHCVDAAVAATVADVARRLPASGRSPAAEAAEEAA
jgi:hypothetical protein